MRTDAFAAEYSAWLRFWRGELARAGTDRLTLVQLETALEIEIANLGARLALLETQPGGPALVRAGLHSLVRLYAARRELPANAQKMISDARNGETIRNRIRRQGGDQ